MTSLQSGQVRNRHLILGRGKKCSYSPKLPGCETDHRHATSAKVNPSVAKLKKFCSWLSWYFLYPRLQSVLCNPIATYAVQRTVYLESSLSSQSVLSV